MDFYRTVIDPAGGWFLIAAIFIVVFGGYKWRRRKK